MCGLKNISQPLIEEIDGPSAALHRGAQQHLRIPLLPAIEAKWWELITHLGSGDFPGKTCLTLSPAALLTVFYSQDTS